MVFWCWLCLIIVFSVIFGGIMGFLSSLWFPDDEKGFSIEEAEVVGEGGRQECEK